MFFFLSAFETDPTMKYYLVLHFISYWKIFFFYTQFFSKLFNKNRTIIPILLMVDFSVIIQYIVLTVSFLLFLFFL